MFTIQANRNRSWIQELKRAVDRMSAKLRKYYTKTNDTFVYDDDAILHLRGKTIFTQDSQEKKLADKCIQGCRERFIKNYCARSDTSSTTVPAAYPSLSNIL